MTTTGTKHGAGRQMTTSADPFVRCMAFVDAYLRAPNDADIEFRIGTDTHGNAAVIVSFGGTDHGFLASEARKVADVLESALNAHPTHPDSRGLPNAIMSLRHTANEAEQRAKAERPHGK